MWIGWRVEGKEERNAPDDGLFLDIASSTTDDGHPIRRFLSNSSIRISDHLVDRILRGPQARKKRHYHLVV